MNKLLIFRLHTGIRPFDNSQRQKKQQSRDSNRRNLMFFSIDRHSDFQSVKRGGQFFFRWKRTAAPFTDDCSVFNSTTPDWNG